MEPLYLLLGGIILIALIALALPLYLEHREKRGH